MEFAHRGLFTSLPYMITFPDKPAAARHGHTRMMLHGNNTPRAQADVWLYLGIDVPIPEEIMATQQNRRITTTENLNRPFYEYKTPDVFDKVVYLDDAPEDVMAGAQESADWLD